MIDGKKSGYLVQTKDGRIGRTVHEKGMINGKLPVYLADKTQEVLDREGKLDFIIPVTFEKTAILCDPKTLKHLGFID